MAKFGENYSRLQLGQFAQRIEPRAKWSDLKLSGLQISILEIAIKARQRLGITVLFTGENSKGKSMASEVLANELELDLYRIDLCKLINKYIGETEKNLKKIFDAAEEGGVILLFDEADALFGERSEVKDCHDRYANSEVNYLLQRMEDYRGLAILTTNMKSTADNRTFMDRIPFVVNFPFPVN